MVMSSSDFLFLNFLLHLLELSLLLIYVFIQLFI
jgi:hypothetical protein